MLSVLWFIWLSQGYLEFSIQFVIVWFGFDLISGLNFHLSDIQVWIITVFMIQANVGVNIYRNFHRKLDQDMKYCGRHQQKHCRKYNITFFYLFIKLYSLFLKKFIQNRPPDVISPLTSHLSKITLSLDSYVTWSNGFWSNINNFLDAQLLEIKLLHTKWR